MNRLHLGKRIQRLKSSVPTTSLVHIAAKDFFATKEATRLAEREAQGKSLKEYPYISDAEVECPRQVVYSLINAPKTDPPDLQGYINMEVGLRVEQMVGDFFQAAGYQPLSQERLAIPAGITTVVSGRPDFLLTAPDGKELVEVKKVKVWAFNDALLQNGPTVDDRGVRQGNLYVHGARLGQLGEEWTHVDGLNLVWVVTESVKGEPGLFSWQIPYNEALAQEDLAYLEAMKVAANAAELPPPPPPKNIKKRWTYTWNSWPCGWCPYRSRCYEEAPEGRKGGPAK